MTERPLFRQAAVDHRAKARDKGRVLVWRDRAASRAFAALVVLVAGSIVTSLVLPVHESAVGTVQVSAGTRDAVLLLPIGVSPHLRRGQAVRLRLDHDVITRISRVDVPRTVNGRTYAVAHAPVKPIDAGSGTAVVLLDTHSLAATLVPALR